MKSKPSPPLLNPPSKHTLKFNSNRLATPQNHHYWASPDSENLITGVPMDLEKALISS